MYKQFPEYQKLNYNISLSEFKSIFFWEYAHRMSGSLIGLFMLLPWLYFSIRKRLSSSFNLKMLALFILLVAQGLLGWYMVQSGLIDKPQVSHYRLAALTSGEPTSIHGKTVPCFTHTRERPTKTT